MRTAAEVGIVATMQSASMRIIVELKPGEPVCGSAGRDGEPPIPFEGMLGFLSLFEHLRTPDAAARDPRVAKFNEAH